MEKVFPVSNSTEQLWRRPRPPQQIPSKLSISTQLGKGEKHKLRLTFPPLKSRKKPQEATQLMFPGTVFREELLPCLLTS